MRARIHRPIIAVVIFIMFAVCPAGRGVTISGGTYNGSPGYDASGSSTENIAGDGNEAYLFAGGSNLITAGTFVGGAGGNATGGEVAQGGEGGDGVDYSSAGAGLLTITTGSFQGGAGGKGSGASQINVTGTAGIAFSLDGQSSALQAVIEGGTYQGYYDFEVTAGVVEMVGTFAGGPRTLTTYGSFSGLLANNTTPATYTYETDDGGEIILVSPESTAAALLISPAILLIRKRRQTVGNK